MERSIPIPLFSATLAEMRLNRTLMEKYDVNGTLAEMRFLIDREFINAQK